MSSSGISRRSVIVLLAGACLVGCAKSGGGGGSGPASLNVSGRVLTGGPVRGATVRVLAGSTAGGALEPLGQATTNQEGSFALDVVVSPGTYVLCVATGGEYVDDASKRTLTLAAPSVESLLSGSPRAGVLEALFGTGVAAVATGSRVDAHLTPLTTIASRRVLDMAQSDGRVLEEAVVAKVNEAVTRELGVGSADVPVDARTVRPLDFANTADASAIQSSPLAPPALYGAVLSGLSKLANTATPIELTDALARDYEDGAFDGRVRAAGPPIAIGSSPDSLSPLTVTAHLTAKTREFLADPQLNQSGTGLGAVSPH